MLLKGQAGRSIELGSDKPRRIASVRGLCSLGIHKVVGNAVSERCCGRHGLAKELIQGVDLRVFVGGEQARIQRLFIGRLAGDFPQQVAGVREPFFPVGRIAHLVDAAQQRHVQRAVVLHRVARDVLPAELHRLAGGVIEWVFTLQRDVLELDGSELGRIMAGG